jgi:mycothiol synthase
MPPQVTARPYVGEPDLERVSAMLDACESVDRMGLRRTPDELRAGFHDPAVDPAHDIQLWEDEGGRVVGYGLVEVKKGDVLEGTLRFRVHPAVRAHNLDAQVMTWAESRMGEIAQNGAARLLSMARDDDKRRKYVLEQHHYQPVRYFYQLERSLTRPINEPQFPPGFTLRQADPTQDAEAWIAMFNQTFIDHWDHHDLTLEEYQHQRQTDPGYTPKHDLIAIAPDGTFAALCWSIINRTEIARSGRKQALLHQIGTRRGFRKIGLGRAMLLAALHALKEDGMESVRLYVDADNPTGATQLYDSAGFQKVFMLITYAKDVNA